MLVVFIFSLFINMCNNLFISLLLTIVILCIYLIIINYLLNIHYLENFDNKKVYDTSSDLSNITENVGTLNIGLNILKRNESNQIDKLKYINNKLDYAKKETEKNINALENL